MRLEADRNVTNCKIAEVGFDPETGDWYYKCMRPDKTTSNHIGTVMGTLLELAENITQSELRMRMMMVDSRSDSYLKDKKNMEKQMVEYQRGLKKKEDERAIKAAAGGGA